MTRPDPIKTFTLKAPWIMAKLREDFAPLSEMHAGAVLGNLGHECRGFTALQEERPLIPGSRGGTGWPMWTASRRVKYEAYCARNDLDPRSDKANYAFLFLELRGPYKRALAELRKTETLDEAVRAFERIYEGAHPKHKHYGSRLTWAQRAIAAYRKAAEAGLVAPHNPNPPPATRKEEHMETVKNVVTSKTLIGLAAAAAAPYLAKYGVTEAGTAALIQDIALGFAAFGRFVASKRLVPGDRLAS